MRIRQAIFLAVFLSIGSVAVSACSQASSTISLDDVPVYAGAQSVDSSRNATTAAVARQDKIAIANGHKSESRAFALPKGTTPAQVREFYVSRLTQLGGQVVMDLGDDAPFGNMTLQHGSQALTIEYDAMSDPAQPILMIESFIPNGCRDQSDGCK